MKLLLLVAKLAPTGLNALLAPPVNVTTLPGVASLVILKIILRPSVGVPESALIVKLPA